MGHGAYMIFIDFGRDVRADFTVMLTPDVAEGLAAGGIPPDSLTGRRVRVRGILEDSGGPALRLNDPAELELVD